MNCTVENDGTIVLKTTPKEAELLYNAVQSKHLILRHKPDSKEKCNQLLEIQPYLNEAIVESNKVRMKLHNENVWAEIEKEAAVFSPKRSSLWHRIVNFFDSPFCTHDYEWAHTRCGAKFTIDGMVFSSKLYPSEVYGTVETEDGEVQVTWNDRGRCSSKAVIDVQCYDLILRDQKERDSGIIVGYAFLILIFLLIFFSLYL